MKRPQPRIHFAGARFMLCIVVRPPIPQLHSIRGVMGCCHLLEDGAASVMIDTGMVGEPFFIRRLVGRLGLKPTALKAILLTHGHLDHAGNLAWLQEWSGAKVFAHPDEQPHINGTYPYEGVTKWCGRLEAAGAISISLSRDEH